MLSDPARLAELLEASYAERDKMRDALEVLADVQNWKSHPVYGGANWVGDTRNAGEHPADIARQALKERRI